MDKSSTKVLFGANIVNQQVLDAPNSPSVSQRGISYCGVNTVERPKKDNKSLLYYTVKPPEELPLVFLDAQESEFSDSDSSSKDARKTLNTPTASEQIPYTAPSQIEHTNKSSSIGNPSVRTVKYTCRNALIERLQHGEKLSVNKLIKAMKKAYSNHSFQPLSLIRSLKKNKIFSYIMIYDDCYKKDIKHWYMTETAMKDMKISIISSSTTQDSSSPKVYYGLSYKKEIIEQLQNKKNMSVDELCEAITEKNKYTPNKYSIRNLLKKDKTFERAGSCLSKAKRKIACWSIRGCGKTPISDPVLNFEKTTPKEIVLYFLRNGKEMTSSQIRAKFFKECPQAMKLDHSWNKRLQNVLTTKNKCLERVPNSHGIMNKKGAPWRIKKDTREYKASIMMVEDEKYNSGTTTPPIIQPHLPPTISEIEHQDVQRLESRFVQTTLAVISNEEQKLALQPEPHPIQLDHGLDLPLIPQGYKSVALEWKDL